MKYGNAKFLCREDEVRIKKTGEIVTVSSVNITDKDVTIYVNSREGYIPLNHKQVD